METAPFPDDDTRAGGTPVRVHESTDHGCGQTCRGMEGLVRRQVLAQRTRADVNVRPRPPLRKSSQNERKKHSQKNVNSSDEDSSVS